jgi:hypothetical protein
MQMRTIITGRAETRSISIAAPPEAVVALVGDARRLPDWAPAFASSVAPEGGGWRIGSGEGSFTIAVEVSPERGTVDLVSTANRRRGGFLRAIPNGGGSELLFTLLFPEGTDAAAVDAQMATVEGELASVRSLCEAAS